MWPHLLATILSSLGEKDVLSPQSFSFSSLKSSVSNGKKKKKERKAQFRFPIRRDNWLLELNRAQEGGGRREEGGGRREEGCAARRSHPVLWSPRAEEDKSHSVAFASIQLPEGTLYRAGQKHGGFITKSSLVLQRWSLSKTCMRPLGTGWTPS
jgi:hypothetical protein